ncbi:MAG: HAMP domain-containing histidine kinase, partial [Myxococcales bacterium]|nr:HAMP domain-containing histidine kinase [Myxococcales bacterium]
MPGPGKVGLDGLRRLADALSDGMAVCKGDRIVWTNRPLADFVGRAPETLLGEAPSGLLAPGAPPLADGIETRLVRASGQAMTVRVRHVENDDGSTTWLFHDRARASELEAEVLALSRALRETNLALASLREREKRQRADLDEVLTVVSHELRTPVTVVSGYARLLLSEQVGALNDEQRGFLEESLKSCRRLNSFIANLLVNSRDAGSDAPLQVRDASLDTTLESALQSVKPLLDEQGIVPRVICEPGTPAARHDPVRIEQVLTNLLENALKYAHPGGALEIRCRRLRSEEGDFVEVSVCDDGPGVPVRDRQR